MDVDIREAVEADDAGIAEVVCGAFGEEEGPVLVALIDELMVDATAQPVASLVAEREGQILGHILFTRVLLEGTDRVCSILAPLAVHPDHQSQGIGGRLIREGVERLLQGGTDLIFVLGYPDYYSRFGFVEAGGLGFRA
ncbi:MAG: GNAT family N-acetyltransferase, partial [Planctomycetota bacterium]